MARTKIDVGTVCVFGGPAYEIMTEDGPGARFDYFVGISHGTAEYVHYSAFRQKIDGERLAARVRHAGSIDLAYWSRLEPRPSLEERFAMYAEREQEARMGLRGEDDLYDGLPS